ncbi:MAG: hypothetical protein LC118_10740, partial [Dehalococcoidia bacterium]|nr:hypothetical protein [Dehalococcoidia bacterium]
AINHDPRLNEKVLGIVFALAIGRALQELRRVSTAGNFVVAAVTVLAIVQCLTFVPNTLLPGQPPREFRWGLEGAGLTLVVMTWHGVRARRSQPWSRGPIAPVG